MSHEGFKNYETWSVNLWLNNDEGLYNEVKERVRHLNANTKDEAIEELSDSIKEFVTELQPELQGLWQDLVTTSLQEVDWDEIAEDFLCDETFKDDDDECCHFD